MHRSRIPSGDLRHVPCSIRSFIRRTFTTVFLTLTLKDIVNNRLAWLNMRSNVRIKYNLSRYKENNISLGAVALTTVIIIMQFNVTAGNHVRIEIRQC